MGYVWEVSRSLAAQQGHVPESTSNPCFEAGCQEAPDLEACALGQHRFLPTCLYHLLEGWLRALWCAVMDRELWCASEIGCVTIDTQSVFTSCLHERFHRSADLVRAYFGSFLLFTRNSEEITRQNGIVQPSLRIYPQKAVNDLKGSDLLKVVSATYFCGRLKTDPRRMPSLWAELSKPKGAHPHRFLAARVSIQRPDPPNCLSPQLPPFRPRINFAAWGLNPFQSLSVIWCISQPTFTT